MPELRTTNDVLREIRRVATFVAFGAEFKQRMKKGELHRHMSLVFHGDPNDRSSAPYSQQICQGVGAFKDLIPDLFEQETVPVTSTEADVEESLTKFYIKDDLLLDKNRRFSIGMSDDCDIHPKRLSTKTINSSEVIKGKTLFTEAKDKVFMKL